MDDFVLKKKKKIKLVKRSLFQSKTYKISVVKIAPVVRILETELRTNGFILLCISLSILKFVV